MKIVIDTREQEPYRFERWPDTETVRGSLSTADYSIQGVEHFIGLERKGSINDLITCLGKDRERFERELSRGRGLDFFAVVCEFNYSDIVQGLYRGRMNAHSACQSIAAFSIRYGSNFIFAGSREHGEYLTYSLLSKFDYEIRKKYKTLVGDKVV